MLLTSCLGVHITTRFNGDGSGTVTTKLRISKALLEMSAEQGSSPIPLTKQDLEKAYADLPGVKVESVSETTTDADKIITATVDFRDFSVFKDSKDLAGTGATISVGADGRTTYSVTIGEPQRAQAAIEAGTDAPANKQADQAVTEMFTNLMQGYALEYDVTAPRKILSHSLGDLSADGRTVSYSIPMADLVNLTAPLTFTVVW